MKSDSRCQDPDCEYHAHLTKEERVDRRSRSFGVYDCECGQQVAVALQEKHLTAKVHQRQLRRVARLKEIGYQLGEELKHYRGKRLLCDCGLYIYEINQQAHLATRFHATRVVKRKDPKAYTKCECGQLVETRQMKRHLKSTLHATQLNARNDPFGRFVCDDCGHKVLPCSRLSHLSSAVHLAATGQSPLHAKPEGLPSRTWRRETTTCVCGATVQNKGMSLHLISNRHRNNLARMTKNSETNE